MIQSVELGRIRRDLGNKQSGDSQTSKRTSKQKSSNKEKLQNIQLNKKRMEPRQTDEGGRCNDPTFREI